MTKKSRQKIPTPLRTQLFHFTEEEEKQIWWAKVCARKFMENYGKGYEVPMIDLTQYAQNDGTAET